MLQTETYLMIANYGNKTFIAQATRNKEESTKETTTLLLVRATCLLPAKI